MGWLRLDELGIRVVGNTRKKCTAVAIVVLCGSILPLGGASAQGLENEVDPERPWVTEADQLLREGRAAAANRAYRELLGAHATDSGLWLRIAVVESRLRQAEPALEAARKAVELAPGELEPLVLLAQIQVAVGEIDDGMGTLLTALEDHPGDVDILQTMASIAINVQRWAEATGLLRELIRIAPDQSDYHLDLGRILLTQGDFDASAASFEAARAIGGDPAVCAALIGKAHLASGRADEAVAAFENSNRVRPNGDAWGGLATVFSLRGERARAIQAFRKALDHAPGDPDLHYNLGNVLAQSDRLEEAEESYRKALALDPSAAGTHTNLAVLLLNRFAVTEAEQHLRLAIKLDPRSPGPYLHLGRIAGARYEYGEAIRNYRRYKSLADDPREVARIDGVLQQLVGHTADSETALAAGKVHLLQLMVSEGEKALQLIARLRRGEDFFVLAHRESELASIAGVDAGFIEIESIHESFQAPVRKLSVGDITEPIQIENGFYVFKRVE